MKLPCVTGFRLLDDFFREFHILPSVAYHWHPKMEDIRLRPRKRLILKWLMWGICIDFAGDH